MKTESNLIFYDISFKKNRKTPNGEKKFEPYTENASGTNTKKQTSNLKINNFNLPIKEIAILASLAKGYSYKMIGDDHSIAINTVREHISNIYHKLKVHSCIEAVLLAFKKSLL